MTTTKAACTPGPWRTVVDPTMLGDDEDYHTAHYIEGCSRDVSERGHVGQIELAEDAAFIVLACNAYDADQQRIAELEAALREYTERHEAACDPTGLPEYDQARDVLARKTNA